MIFLNNIIKEQKLYVLSNTVQNALPSANIEFIRENLTIRLFYTLVSIISYFPYIRTPGRESIMNFNDMRMDEIIAGRTIIPKFQSEIKINYDSILNSLYANV